MAFSTLIDQIGHMVCIEYQQEIMYEEINGDSGFNLDPLDQGQGQTVSYHIQMACRTLIDHQVRHMLCIKH